MSEKDRFIPEEIVIGQLILRRIDLMDVNDVHEAVISSLPSLQKWFGWAHGFNRSSAANFVASCWNQWQRGESYEFTIKLNHHDQLLGLCGLNSIREGDGNLGYWIREGERGRGVCTQAARRLAQFGFENLKLSRISLYHAVGNRPSRRVAEKVGFRFEGLQRSRVEVSGVRHDTRSYALTSIEELTSFSDPP